VRYIWLRQASSVTATGLALDQMNIVEFQAFDQNGTNVATSAAGSTVVDIQPPYTGWSTANYRLIDNVTTMLCGSPPGEAAVLAHSGQWTPGWMLIDLGQPRDIRAVRLIHRSKWQARRQNGAAIELHQSNPIGGGATPLWRKCIVCSYPFSDQQNPCGPVHQFPVCP
jgi:hypothetical protein